MSGMWGWRDEDRHREREDEDGEEVPENYRLIDEIYNLKTRHTNQQIRDIIFKQRLELLLDRLALLEKKEG